MAIALISPKKKRLKMESQKTQTFFNKPTVNPLKIKTSEVFVLSVDVRKRIQDVIQLN